MTDMKRRRWDHTTLTLTQDPAAPPPTPQQLEALHTQIWRQAFTSLGKDNRLELYGLDPHVTLQPTAPAMWFYPDGDLREVSPRALTYAFPATELGEPEFVHIPVHHWFRLGLARGRSSIARLAARSGLSVTLPTLEEELPQTTFILATVRGELRQILGSSAEELTLLSASGWTRVDTLAPEEREWLVGVWSERQCRCPVCCRLRPRQDPAALDAETWARRLEALVAEHGEGARLLGAMLELRGGDDFFREVREWLEARGAGVAQEDPEAGEVLRRHLSGPLAVRTAAARLLVPAFRRASAAGKQALLPAVAEALRSDERAIVLEGLKVALQKKHLSPGLLEQLRGLAASPGRDADSLSCLATHLETALEGKLTAPPVPELARCLLASSIAAVRARAVRAVKQRLLLKPRSRLSPDERSLLDAVVELAAVTLHPEYVPLLLARVDELPPALAAQLTAG